MRNSHQDAMLSPGAATVGFRLSFLANFYTEPVYKEVTRRFGIARSEFVVLLCLRQLGTLNAQDVCEITGRPKNSISQAVGKLEAAGHIKRRADDQDLRRSHLSITAAGRRLCVQIVPLFMKREQEMLAVLSDAQRKSFEASLEKLTLRDDDWASAY